MYETFFRENDCITQGHVTLQPTTPYLHCEEVIAYSMLMKITEGQNYKFLWKKRIFLYIFPLFSVVKRTVFCCQFSAPGHERIFLSWGKKIFICEPSYTCTFIIYLWRVRKETRQRQTTKKFLQCCGGWKTTVLGKATHPLTLSQNVLAHWDKREREEREREREKERGM
jgi:hypothetical protein